MNDAGANQHPGLAAPSLLPPHTSPRYLCPSSSKHLPPFYIGMTTSRISGSHGEMRPPLLPLAAIPCLYSSRTALLHIGIPGWMSMMVLMSP
jgi:hypothetical protein